MYNWSTDLARLKKNQPNYQRFVLESRINFGLNGQKISLSELKKYWDTLQIDPQKKEYLQKLVWPQS